MKATMVIAEVDLGKPDKEPIYRCGECNARLRLENETIPDGCLNARYCPQCGVLLDASEEDG